MYRDRKGFTLVELVVVILILGILATVAVPRFLDLSTDAAQGALQQDLAVIRNAIELFAVQNGGALPGQSDNLPVDLQPYLRRGIPNSPAGVTNASITYVSVAGAITGDASERTGWKYNRTTGDFICNHEDFDQF
jgi:prepilin-type N-terminal cleavage/methylation domain-containing protein